MSLYITYSGGTITPKVVSGYESKRKSATVTHPILGRSNPDATLRPAELRTGTLTLVFATEGAGAGGELIQDGDGYVHESDPAPATNAETDSKACEDAHAAGDVFSLVSTELPTIVMTYVHEGDLTRTFNDETRGRVWTVKVDYREVVP